MSSKSPESEELIDNFIDELWLERGLSKNTLNAYRQDISSFNKWLKTTHLLEVTKIELLDYLAYRLKKGYSSRSTARSLSSLRALYNQLSNKYNLKENPTAKIDSPKLGHSLPKVISEEEVETLIKAPDIKEPIGLRDRAMLELIYACGLRVSELINLRFEELFFNEGFIRIIGKGNKQRLVPVSKSVEKEINIYVNNFRRHKKIKPSQESYVFLNRRGSQLTRVMIFIIIQKLKEKTGIKKKVSPHTFRHSFATHLIEGGANLRAVQEMLGHESITTTEIYTHLDKDYLRSNIIQFHPRG